MKVINLTKIVSYISLFYWRAIFQEKKLVFV
jgi:hypothetical protein